MKNLWSDRDAKAAIAHYAKQGVNRDLALRTYTTRLLGGVPDLVQHGGGNTSAKVMETEPDVIIIDEPTRGIDVGTKQQIYHFISALARDGKSIIVVSSEMPEIIGLCTRVAVMREGRIVGILEGEEISEQEIMRYSAGLKKKTAA